VIRAIIALFIVAAISALAVFFAGNPGRVVILWHGWQIETSVAVLIAAAAAIAVAAVLVLRLLALVLRSPAAFARRRRERRRWAGYQALTRGMVAVAAGEPQEARRYARRAEALLAEPPLTLLLSAQTAQLNGDELAAKNFFTAMLERPETEFLGLRGLLNQALREGDYGAARQLTERALDLRPNTGWAAASLFDLEIRDQRWEAARAALDRADKARSIPATTARHHRGVIFYELSRAAEAGDEQARAIALAAEARSLATDLAPLAAHHARLLLAQGKPNRAERAIERAWRTAPDPQLAALYGKTRKRETALGRLSRYQRLAAQNPTAQESHLILAEASLAAELWGEARRHLDRAMAAEPPPVASAPVNSAGSRATAAPVPATDTGTPRATARICLMMARVDEAEHADPTRTREWLDRAVHALPEPRYVCGNCGGDSVEWHSICRLCGAFDTLAWRTPAWSGSVGMPQVRFDAALDPPAVALETASAPLTTLPAVEPTAQLMGNRPG
jgi:HemY protein